MTAMAPLTAGAAWKALDTHFSKIRDLHLRKLFADDATRGERMAVEAVGIYFDYSKHRITDEALSLPDPLHPLINYDNWNNRQQVTLTLGGFLFSHSLHCLSQTPTMYL